jgi:hypothetical protein
LNKPAEGIKKKKILGRSDAEVTPVPESAFPLKDGLKLKLLP